MTSVRAATCASLLATLFVGCSGNGTDSNPPPRAPRTATIVSGNNQVGLTEKVLVRPLVVRVTTDGVPTAGAAVTWTASAGSAVIGATTTDADGLVSVGWILGEAAGAATMTASIDGGATTPVSFDALALGYAGASPDRSTLSQSGAVGSALAKPLRVVVSSGSRPVPGVEVAWETSDGEVFPATSVTGADGSASTSWTLGHQPGSMLATASVERVTAPLSFQATASAGPPALITPAPSAPSTPANWPFWDPIQASVNDAFGNPVEDVTVEWRVISGPAVLLTAAGQTNAMGSSQATFAPTGAEGVVEVEARPSGTTISAQFYLEAGPRQLNIRLNLRGASPVFVSGQNGTSPAVDTIPVGAVMTWIRDGWDYDNHRIAPFGGSPFPDPGEFQPYEHQVQATFNVPPGTYTYWDFESGAMGTIVVQ